MKAVVTLAAASAVAFVADIEAGLAVVSAVVLPPAAQPAVADPAVADPAAAYALFSSQYSSQAAVVVASMLKCHCTPRKRELSSKAIPPIAWPFGEAC